MHAGHVGGRILLTGAEIRHRQGNAVDFSQSDASDLFCDNMTAVGTVQLAGIKIAHHLRMTGVHLGPAAGNALDASSCQAGEFSLQPAEVRGAVLLDHARLGIYRDDPACWPGQRRLDGLSYDVLEPRLPARQRLRWLTSNMPVHQPQPFEQLAAFYTRIGQPGEARRVLHAKERSQRSAKTPLGRVWSLLQDITVGYGYQPWRALLRPHRSRVDPRHHRRSRYHPHPPALTHPGCILVAFRLHRDTDSRPQAWHLFTSDHHRRENTCWLGTPAHLLFTAAHPAQIASFCMPPLDCTQEATTIQNGGSRASCNS